MDARIEGLEIVGSSEEFRPSAEAFIAEHPDHPDSQTLRRHLDFGFITRETIEDLVSGVKSIEARRIVFKLVLEIASGIKITNFSS